MFITIEKETYTYKRTSKLGREHEYERVRTLAVFRCDSCGNNFKRLQGSMDPKRISNSYYHCCNHCDSKKFAQKKGVERRRIWDMPASSLIPISKL